MEIKDKCSKPLKELKKGEYFRWDRKRDSKSIFKKGSYDRSLKKYKCREYLWKKEWLLGSTLWLSGSTLWLSGSTLVRKNPQ
tara:strand:+ start:1325 stop:1570 length:246 start_codon:yes stop_codon:yes gene_type:complete